jgi:two-component system CheB/CheR fusion protein
MIEEEQQTKANTEPQPPEEVATPESRLSDTETGDDGRKEAAPFPIVALGASAGGLDALTKFFTAMPAASGLGFLVIVHLDPRHASHLPELLGRKTSMPVMQAQEGTRVKPDHVYVIPPNTLLSIHDGRLHLTEAVKRPAIPMPIDHCFRALAEDRQERAIGIILSGNDADGSLGSKKIKAEGGLVMVQEPATASYDSMPRSTIATKLVDYVLPVERMPETLLQYVEHARLRADASPNPETANEDELQKILALLRVRAGHDFRFYRRPMLMRRIGRRMGLTHIRQVEEYRNYLKETPAEVDAMVKDLLIGVTEFFREPEAWQVLAREVVRPLIAGKQVDAGIRAWVPGCATGEEAYSLAMLLLDQETIQQRYGKIQLFATDIDKEALEYGRAGNYPESVAYTIPPDYVKRFFTRSGSVYQVKKELRETVLFAPQNLITDSPFSRMDLISCRNLLIYLEPELQQKIIELFHFALNPGGYLFLGKAESVSRTGLFEPVSRKWRIYRRSNTVRQTAQDFPLVREPTPGEKSAARRHSAPPRATYRELTQQLLLERYAPAAVLVSRNYHVLYFHGPVQDYLTLSGGEPTDDVIALARPELRLKLRAALHQAIHADTTAVTTARIARGQDVFTAQVTVAPLKADEDGLLLVTLNPDPRAAASPPDGTDDSLAARQLEDELNSTKRELESVIQELEGTNEELKVANEEVMSMNEELQSTNEELETSKEELQSLNEELSTVNSQLEGKVEELERANDDLNNLLSSTHVPTLFLDRQFRVKRFTPDANRLFNLIPADIGRPITDIASSFANDGLLADARQVLDALVPLDKEIQVRGNGWYLRRILPYRTQQDHIEGVVVTFTDITKLKRAEESTRRFATVMQDSNDAILLCDLDGRILAWNRGAEAIYGYAESEALTLNKVALVPESERPALYDLLQRVRGGERAGTFETRRITKNGAIIDISLTFSVLQDESGRPAIIASTERDITGRKRVERTLREQADQLRAADRRKDEFLAMLAHELRNPLAPIRNAVEVLRHADPAQKSEIDRARDLIDRQVQYLTRLVNDLLDVSRAIQGKIKLDKKLIELSAFVNQAVEFSRELIAARRHRLSVSLPPQPVYLEGDLLRLAQVLSNLLDNAAKYTDEGGQIWLTAEQVGEEAVIRVRDTGIGMPAKLIKRVFGLFTQAERPLDRPQGGLGIGLSLARRLVELHGGRVEAFSGGPGQGSEFVVWLPARAAPQATAGQENESRPAVPSTGRRILVVDDNADAAESLAMMLQLNGHEVRTALDGPAALEAARAFKPQFVLLDIGLPGMSGYEVAGRLRQRPETQKAVLIAVTGYSQAEDRQRSKEAGFDHHLAKPVTLDELNAALNSLG